MAGAIIQKDVYMGLPPPNPRWVALQSSVQQVIRQSDGASGLIAGAGVGYFEIPPSLFRSRKFSAFSSPTSLTSALFLILRKGNIPDFLRAGESVEVVEIIARPLWEFDGAAQVAAVHPNI
jgi:hypothetical protein